MTVTASCVRRIGIAIARRHRRVRFKNLAISKRIREAADQGDNAPIRFGDRYSVIMRGGRAVLHLLSDYYSDAVLEAAQDEDIEPLGTRGHTTSLPLFLGDLYVGEVNYPPNGNQRTVEAIQRNVNNYTAPAAPTASTPPTLSQLNSSISPSLQSSRRPRRILLDCYHSPPAQSADEWLLNNPSMRCLIGAVNASCTTTTDNETHAQHIIATYPFPLPPNCPGAENQDRLAPRGAMFHSPISNASHRTVYISSLEC